jgi:hypothetical protein
MPKFNNLINQKYKVFFLILKLKFNVQTSFQLTLKKSLKESCESGFTERHDLVFIGRVSLIVLQGLDTASQGEERRVYVGAFLETLALVQRLLRPLGPGQVHQGQHRRPRHLTGKTEVKSTVRRAREDTNTNTS